MRAHIFENVQTEASSAAARAAGSHRDAPPGARFHDHRACSMHRCPKDVRYRSIRPGGEVRLTWAGIAVTIVTAAMVCRHAAGEMYPSLALESVLLAVVLFLIYGSLVYQFSRKGYFSRLRRHRPARLTEIWERLESDTPPVTILVPSYKEEARVVRAALLSAALQHYPNRRVVLMIDDPPFPVTEEDRERLALARALPDRIMQMLEPARRRFAAAL